MPALVTYAAPTAEPLTIAEVMAHLRLDEGNQEPAPEAPTVALESPAAAGNVDNGVHRYRATFVTASGETQAGEISTPVTVVDKAVNGRVSITGIPLGGGAVTARKLYRTAAGGSDYLLLATLADNSTTSYTDNVADASLGAGAPSTNTTNDPLLAQYIAGARCAAESATNQALMTQTLDLYMDAFPCSGTIHLRGPLQSVTEVTYVDQGGVEQTLPEADYQVDPYSMPPCIVPAYGKSWPATRPQRNAVKVRFIAGHTSASAVPAEIKAWMLLSIGALFENRESINVGNIVNEMPYVDALVATNRVHNFVSY